MKIHDAETEKPPINEWVFGCRNTERIELLLWDGTHWHTKKRRIQKNKEKEWFNSIGIKHWESIQEK